MLIKKIFFTILIVLILENEVVYAKKRKWKRRLRRIALGVTLGAVTGGVGAVVMGTSVYSCATIGAVSSGIASAENNRASIGYNSGIHDTVNKHNSISTENHNINKPLKEKQQKISADIDVSHDNLKKSDTISDNKQEIIKQSNPNKNEQIKESIFVQTNKNKDHKTLDVCMKGARDAFFHNSQITNLGFVATKISPKLSLKFSPKLTQRPTKIGDQSDIMSDLDREIYYEEKEKCKNIYNK